MCIVDRIKELCKEKGTTLIGLERELGFGRGTIRRWDTSSPSIERVQKVADYFGVTANYILGREDKKLKDPQEDRDLLISALKKSGILKEDEDISEDNMKKLISILRTTAEAFKN